MITWRSSRGVVAALVCGALAAALPFTFAVTAVAATTTGPLHTTGADSVIYDASNQPVRLVGFNWTGTENGGRSDTQKIADVCGVTWRTPTL